MDSIVQTYLVGNKIPQRKSYGFKREYKSVRKRHEQNGHYRNSHDVKLFYNRFCYMYLVADRTSGTCTVVYGVDSLKIKII